MTYETDPAGIGTGKVYGERELYEGSAGKIRTAGYEYQAVIEFTHETYARATATLPAGAIVLESRVDVLEAFTFTGGTTPEINVGTSGSAGTNGAGVGVVLASTGNATGTPEGTWTDYFAADTDVAVEVSGAPTSVDAGKARVYIKYYYNGLLDGK